MQFITCSHKEDVLNKYLMKSPCLTRHPLIVMKNYSNVSMAYKKAIKFIEDEDIIVFCHHDVYFPLDWDIKLMERIKEIERFDKNWGVLGLAGVNMVNYTQAFTGHIKMNGKKWLYGNMGKFFNHQNYEKVESIDELCLIIKMENLKHIKWDKKCARHFYGTDVSFQLRDKGFNNYIIDNWCEHATDTNASALNGVYSKDFKDHAKYISKKYKFPFVSTCALVNFNLIKK